MTAAAKPAKQWKWEEKEARGINGQLWSLLLAGAEHLQAWGAFGSQEAQSAFRVIPILPTQVSPLPMAIIK